MHNRYLVELERSVNAIDFIMDRLNEEDKTLIDLVYWKGTHTITGAGEKLHMTQRTAYRHIDTVLKAIACEMGFIPE